MSFKNSHHFSRGRRYENIGYNGPCESTPRTSSGSYSRDSRQAFSNDRDFDLHHMERHESDHVQSGHFSSNCLAEPESHWNSSEQYRYSSEMQREKNLCDKPSSHYKTQNFLGSSHQTFLPSMQYIASDSVGHSSRANSRSPRRVRNLSKSPVSIHSSYRNDQSCAICINNLPSRSSNCSLKTVLFNKFLKYGEVTTVNIFGSGSNRYAIVYFMNSEDSEKAIEAAHGREFLGTKIQVSQYKGLEPNRYESKTTYDLKLDEFHPFATRTLFIDGLDKEITASELRTLFEPFGKIIDIDIKNQNASTLAFCQYSDIQSVVMAIKKLDGEYFGSKRLKLKFGISVPNRCIWIGGISNTLIDTVLCEHFSKFGTITYRNINREIGHALIEFENEEQASFAVREIRGCILNGKKLRIDFASKVFQEYFINNLKKQQYLGQSDSRLKERCSVGNRNFEEFPDNLRGNIGWQRFGNRLDIASSYKEHERQKNIINHSTCDQQYFQRQPDPPEVNFCKGRESFDEIKSHLPSSDPNKQFGKKSQFVRDKRALFRRKLRLLKRLPKCNTTLQKLKVEREIENCNKDLQLLFAQEDAKTADNAIDKS